MENYFIKHYCSFKNQNNIKNLKSVEKYCSNFFFRRKVLTSIYRNFSSKLLFKPILTTIYCSKVSFVLSDTEGSKNFLKLIKNWAEDFFALGKCMCPKYQFSQLCALVCLKRHKVPWISVVLLKKSSVNLMKNKKVSNFEIFQQNNFFLCKIFRWLKHKFFKLFALIF